MKKKKLVLIAVAALLVLGALILLAINLTVVLGTRADIRNPDKEEDYLYALILGAKVHEGGILSDMLRDRMDAGIALYQEGSVKKLLLSGDNSGKWGEVTAMKEYAMKNGIPEADIIMDEEGFSTYESLSRAKQVYGIEKLVIVTQKYHLYRALYIAKHMDITAVGCDAALHSYGGQLYREIREILARVKDFGLCLFD